MGWPPAGTSSEDSLLAMPLGCPIIILRVSAPEGIAAFLFIAAEGSFDFTFTVAETCRKENRWEKRRN